MSETQNLMSTRIYDATVGNPQASRRSWKPLDRQKSQHLGWYPWGTIKKHLQDPEVWGEDLTDKG
eukprot:6599090-Heterocapsa_arctica.AAC.1